MFQVVTGSFQKLESAFLADISEKRANDPLTSLLVLSPSGRLLTHLQTRLTQIGPGFLNIHFLTFYALAERLLSNSAHTDPIVTEPALYEELIKDLLEGKGETQFILRDKLHPADHPLSKGLPGALVGTIRDLQDSGAKVTDSLNVALEGHLGEEAGAAAPTLELFARVYETLQKHNLRTPADLLRRATELAPRHPWIHKQKAIFLYGFYDLTGVQLDLLLSLAAYPNARIYFPYEEGNPAYAFAEKLLKDPIVVSKSSSELRVPRENKNSALLGTEKSELGTSVDAWSCSGAKDEVWLAAKQVLAQYDKGIPFGDMAILSRSIVPYLSDLREVFEAHHIPYSSGAEEPVSRFPLMKVARQVLTLDQQGYAEAILEEIKCSPYVRGSLSARPEALPSEQNAQSWSAQVLWAKKTLGRWIRLSPDATDIEKKLWMGLEETLNSLRSMDLLNRPVHRDRFLEVVERKIEQLTLPLAPANNAGVQILDVMAARGLTFRAVYLLGLNEKSFPRMIREDPFLSDAARSALAQALGSRLNRKLDGYQEEQLLFHLATHQATDHLHLSCQRTDEEGKALVLSLYLQNVLDQRNLDLQRLPRTFMEKLGQAPEKTLAPKEMSIALNREKRDPLLLYQALGWDSALYNNLREAQDRLETFDGLGPHDGLIGEQKVLQKLYDEGFSPSTLKDLAECPFKYFARKVLDLKADEPSIEEGMLTPAATGSLIHSILEGFYKDFAMKKGVKPAPKEWEEHLKRACESAFRHFEKTEPRVYPVLWLSTCREIEAVVKSFVKLDLNGMYENDFAPTYLETEFEETIAELGPAFATTIFRGRTDRIDLKNSPQSDFRVVDYKTGRGGIGRKDKIETAILKGKNFQLPIYLGMVRSWLTKQGKKPQSGSALFYNLKRTDTVDEPLEISDEFWKEYGHDFARNLKFLLNLTENGSFYIRPSDANGYCSWCDFASVCRKEHKPTQIRSENSPLRQSHDTHFSGKPA